MRFGKTKELPPEESQNMTITFSAKEAASYKEKKSQWVIESGRYMSQIGNSSKNIVPVGVLKAEEEEICIERVSPICPFPAGIKRN